MILLEAATFNSNFQRYGHSAKVSSDEFITIVQYTTPSHSPVTFHLPGHRAQTMLGMSLSGTKPGQQTGMPPLTALGPCKSANALQKEHHLAWSKAAIGDVSTFVKYWNLRAVHPGYSWLYPLPVCCPIYPPKRCSKKYGIWIHTWQMTHSCVKGSATIVFMVPGNRMFAIHATIWIISGVCPQNMSLHQFQAGNWVQLFFLGPSTYHSSVNQWGDWKEAIPINLRFKGCRRAVWIAGWVINMRPTNLVYHSHSYSVSEALWMPTKPLPPWINFCIAICCDSLSTLPVVFKNTITSYSFSFHL